MTARRDRWRASQHVPQGAQSPITYPHVYLCFAPYSPRTPSLTSPPTPTPLGSDLILLPFPLLTYPSPCPLPVLIPYLCPCFCPCFAFYFRPSLTSPIRDLILLSFPFFYQLTLPFLHSLSPIPHSYPDLTPYLPYLDLPSPLLLLLI